LSVPDPASEPDPTGPVAEPDPTAVAVEPTPTAVEPVDAVVPAEQAPAGPKKLPRAATVALAVAGLLAVTAASAAVTVAVDKPGDVSRTAAAPAATASASTGAASPSASAAPSPTATPTPTPTVAPKPTSTLKGSVSGGKHGGDLRYFLVPVPDQADPYGSPDGADMTMDDIAAHYSKGTDIKGILDSWGFKGAATRTYRTRDGKVEVVSEIKQFGRSDRAEGFAKSSTFKGDSFDVDGVDGAKGYVFKPEQQAYTGELIGIGVEGDIVYEITVLVKGDPDRALLADAMKRQRDRLVNG